MNREEAIKILSLLKAAYPNAYKGMTKTEANGVIGIWELQFREMPYDIVVIALNKAISTSVYPPTISEIKAKIQALYPEAYQMLLDHKNATEGIKFYGDDEPMYYGTKLDDKTLAYVKRILEITEQYRSKQLMEPSLGELLTGLNDYLAVTESDKKQLT